MNRLEKRELKKSKNVIKDLKGIIEKIDKNFFERLNKIKDARHKSYVIYEQAIVIFTMILGHLSGCKSMNDMTNKFNDENVINNINGILKSNYEEIPHGDTINDYLEKLEETELEKIEIELVKKLIRMKTFDKERVFGKFLVAIDGTGIASMDKDPGEHALVRKYKQEDGTIKEKYMYQVLEAKMIVGDVVLSIGTEFIENENREVSKQDCELNAFKRLAKKLKKKFPKQKFIILGDALYQAESVFSICKNNGWDYIIRFKEETSTSKELSFQESYEEINDYKYSNEIRYSKDKNKKIENVKDFLSMCEYETKNKNNEIKKYKYITNINITNENVKEIVKAGRQRWKIENQGFKVQKRCGFNLEHLFSKKYKAIKNHYMIIQISHLFFQMLEIKKEICKDNIERSLAEIYKSLLSTVMILDEIKKESIEKSKKVLT